MKKAEVQGGGRGQLSPGASGGSTARPHLDSGLLAPERGRTRLPCFEPLPEVLCQEGLCVQGRLS